MRRKRHRELKKLVSYSSPYHASHGFVRKVPQLRRNSQPSLIERLRIHPGTNSRMRHCHVSAGLDAHLPEDTHALVGRSRIPVGKPYIRFTRLGPEHLHGKHVFLPYLLGDVETELTERTEHFVLIGNLLTIEPHIGPIADTVKVQDVTFTFLYFCGEIKLGTIPPARLKLLPVNALIVGCCHCLGLYTIGRQHTHQRRRNCGRNPIGSLSSRCGKYFTCYMYLVR